MMSVKKMIELYVRYGVDEETWKMLYNMTLHGLISQDNWKRFSETCTSWTCEGNIITDGDGNVVYAADEQGYWQKT